MKVFRAAIAVLASAAAGGAFVIESDQEIAIKSRHALQKFWSAVEGDLVETFDEFLYPQGTTVLSASGNSMWYNRPAVARGNGVSFFGWVGSDRSVDVATLSEVSGSVLSVSSIHKYRLLDDHGSPALKTLSVANGRTVLLAAYARHNSELFVRTAFPDELVWGDEILVDACLCTYPSIVERKGVIYLFVRKGVGQGDDSKNYGYYRSTDGGKSWDAFRTVVVAGSGDWVYAVPVVSATGDIWLTWGHRRSKTRELHGLFVAKSLDGGDTWQTSDQATSVARIDVADPTFEIFRPQRDLPIRVWDVRLGADGKPEILAVIYDGVDARVALVRSESAGSPVDLGANSFHYYPCGAVFGESNVAYVARLGGGESHDFLEKIEIGDQKWRSLGRTHAKIDQDLCRPVFLGLGEAEVAAHAVFRYASFGDFDTRLLALNFETVE